MRGLVRELGPSPFAGRRIGVEKESLRVDRAGYISRSPHPEGLGSALTHPTITTDFSEALLEFVTPAWRGVRETARSLRHLHQFTYPLIDDQYASRLDGAVLLGVLVIYLGALLRSARRETPEILKEFEAFSEDDARAKPTSVTKNVLLVLLGSGLLVLGGRLIVVSAIDIATAMGISELLIGGTIVAIGTSLPELATSVVAATRNEADIAVGNVIGSNIFNLTAVLGTAAVIEPLSVASGVLGREFLAMFILSALVWPMAWSALKVRRWEGVTLLALYALFWLWLGGSA